MKIKALYLTIGMFLLCSHFTFSQDALNKIKDKLLMNPANFDLFYSADHKPTTFHKDLNSFVSEYQKTQKLTGNLGFGFNGNTTTRQELFRLNTEMSFQRGKYPYQISFKSLLNIQIQNGKLQENLSNLYMSYDRFMNIEPFPILLEWFVFMDRTSNQFMGVNQRYEAGAGYILNFWKSEAKLRDENLAMSKLLNNSINLKMRNDSIFFYQKIKGDNVYTKVDLSKSEFKKLNGAKKSIKQSLRINETKYRIALLVGAFYEAESMSFSDSVLTSTGIGKIAHDFEATNNFRIEFRPTFDFNLSYLKIKIRPYFKLPLTSAWFVERDGRSVYDMRFELPISLGTDITDGFSMAITYNLFHDQAPNSFLSDALAPDGQPIYLTTSRNNHVTTLSVKYTF